MKLRSVIIFLAFFTAKQLFAFDATFMLNKDAFVYEKYNFSIVKVIDARGDKQKPIGIYHPGLLSTKKQTVGNDSIASELQRYFAKYPKSFHESARIILVINQINLIEAIDKKNDDLELTLAFDYYRVTENTAKLEYSQYFKQNRSAGMNKPESINKLFSTAMTAAFLQFKNQIMYYKPLESGSIQITELENKLSGKVVRRIERSNANNGLYFNIHQLIKNAPALSSNYNIISDSALANNQPVQIDSKTYLVKKVFAFVKEGRIYIYIGEGIYVPAIIEEDGKISIMDFYYDGKEDKFNKAPLAGLWPYFPLAALINDIKGLSDKTGKIKVYIDEETGELKI